MSNKSFYANAKRASGTVLPICATGFRNDGGSTAFVSITIGAIGNQHQLTLDPNHARDFAVALTAAADFAEPRVAVAADLGIAA